MSEHPRPTCTARRNGTPCTKVAGHVGDHEALMVVYWPRGDDEETTDE